MLDAGVIAPISPNNVKFVAPTVLAQKAHSESGLSMDEILHCLNDQCVTAGMAPRTDLPLRPDPASFVSDQGGLGNAWRVCQNFIELNRHTEVAPMNQEDIHMKQLCLSSH
jgi:hypothetical protein